MYHLIRNKYIKDKNIINNIMQESQSEPDTEHIITRWYYISFYIDMKNKYIIDIIGFMDSKNKSAVMGLVTNEEFYNRFNKSMFLILSPKNKYRYHPPRAKRTLLSTSLFPFVKDAIKEHINTFNTPEDSRMMIRAYVCKKGITIYILCQMKEKMWNHNSTNTIKILNSIKRNKRYETQNIRTKNIDIMEFNNVNDNIIDGSLFIVNYHTL